MNKVITGSEDSDGIKTFNERYESDVWRLVFKYIKEERRIDGNIAYVVGDVGNLVVGIMKFYEKINKA